MAGRSAARTDLFKFWTERCAGTISEEEWNEMEGGIARSPGFCMTMGTAATMTALAEALGMTLPGASSIPAPDSNHVRMAMGLRPPHCRDDLGGLKADGQILTMEAFENAIAVDMADRRLKRRCHHPSGGVGLAGAGSRCRST